MKLGKFVVIGLLVLAPLVSADAQASAKRDQVTLMLSARHLIPTIDQLEKAAGGKDALIKKLLVLRSDDDTPFVGVRAGRYLLDYADVPEVMAAIEEDLAREDRLGLARVYAINIDRIATDETRRKVAEMLIDLGSKNASFRVYSKVLIDSKDPEISKLARERLM